MTFKPVGVDENSNFPTRVVNKLKTLFPALDGNGKVADNALPNRLQDMALSATYVTFKNFDGSPVTGKHVEITLTADGTDIDNIRVVTP